MSSGGSHCIEAPSVRAPGFGSGIDFAERVVSVKDSLCGTMADTNNFVRPNVEGRNFFIQREIYVSFYLVKSEVTFFELRVE